MRQEQQKRNESDRDKRLRAMPAKTQAYMLALEADKLEKPTDGELELYRWWEAAGYPWQLEQGGFLEQGKALSRMMEIREIISLLREAVEIDAKAAEDAKKNIERMKK